MKKLHDISGISLQKPDSLRAASLKMSKLTKSPVYLLQERLQSVIEWNRGGGGIQNMLTIRVCASHMGGLFGPKFSKLGSFFSEIFLTHHRWAWHKICQKLLKTGSFPSKFMVKMGQKASFSYNQLS